MLFKVIQYDTIATIVMAIWSVAKVSFKTLKRSCMIILYLDKQKYGTVLYHAEVIIRLPVEQIFKLTKRVTKWIRQVGPVTGHVRAYSKCRMRVMKYSQKNLLQSEFIKIKKQPKTTYC